MNNQPTGRPGEDIVTGVESPRIPTSDAQKSVFISYSRKQKDYAERLERILKQRGFAVWIDKSEIDPGENWEQALMDAVSTCAALIVLMTDDAYYSKYVKFEVTFASQLHKPIFPLWLSHKLWPEFEKIQYTDVRNGQMPDDRFFESLTAVAPPRPVSPEQEEIFYLDPRNHEGVAVVGGIGPLISLLGSALLLVALVAFAVNVAAYGNGTVFLSLGAAFVGFGSFFFLSARRVWVIWRLEQSRNVKPLDGWVTHSRIDSFPNLRVGYRFISPRTGKEIRGESWRGSTKKDELPAAGRRVKVAYASDRIHKLL